MEFQENQGHTEKAYLENQIKPAEPTNQKPQISPGWLMWQREEEVLVLKAWCCEFTLEPAQQWKEISPAACPLALAQAPVTQHACAQRHKDMGSPLTVAFCSHVRYDHVLGFRGLSLQ